MTDLIQDIRDTCLTAGRLLQAELDARTLFTMESQFDDGSDS